MRFDRAEVELAGHQQDRRPDGGYPSKTSGAALDGLEGIDLASLPTRNPLGMMGLEGGDFLHRLDQGAHHAGPLALEDGTDNVDLLALADLAQPFLVGPGTRGTHCGHAGAQGIEVGGGLRRTGLPYCG